MEEVKGILCFATFVSWAYTVTAAVACRTAGIEYPGWFAGTAVTAALTFAALVLMCAYDVLKDRNAHNSERKARRREKRCLGVMRYINGVWRPVRDVGMGKAQGKRG